jgi:hypothetical protein
VPEPADYTRYLCESIVCLFGDDSRDCQARQQHRPPSNAARGGRHVGADATAGPSGTTIALSQINVIFNCCSARSAAGLGHPRQNISPEGMSAPDQIAANCCTAVSGVPGHHFRTPALYLKAGETLHHRHPTSCPDSGVAGFGKKSDHHPPISRDGLHHFRALLQLGFGWSPGEGTRDRRRERQPPFRVHDSGDCFAERYPRRKVE